MFHIISLLVQLIQAIVELELTGFWNLMTLNTPFIDSIRETWVFGYMIILYCSMFLEDDDEE